MTSEPKAPELLPCPWCGGCELVKYSTGPGYIVCEHCGAYGPDESGQASNDEFAAHIAWNRRADAAQAMVAAAYLDAAERAKVHTLGLDKVRADRLVQKIVERTPPDASAALTERDNATWNSAIEAAQKAVTAACDEHNAVDEAIARYAIVALKREKP